MTQYASFADFTAVYSIRGVTEDSINSALIFGTTMVNERLGSQFTTPFSSNNRTATELTVDFAFYRLQVRTQAPGDSAETKLMLDDRIKALVEDGAPMMTDSAAPIDTVNAANTVFSNTQNFKPTFDVRDPWHQRVDPDRLDALDDQDGDAARLHGHHHGHHH